MNAPLRHAVDCFIPSNVGDFQMHLFEECVEGEVKQHIALVMGNIREKTDVLARIHSECCTGDIFGCQRCDCQDQLNEAMAMIRLRTEGVLLYLRQEGRGIGLENKLRAYRLQDQGLDTVEANEALGFVPDDREYSVAAEMLKYFGVKSVRLITNNANKVTSLEENGIPVSERVPIVIHSPLRDRSNLFRIKQKKLGHVFDRLDVVPLAESIPEKYPLIAPHIFHRSVPLPAATEEYAEGVRRRCAEDLGNNLRSMLIQGPNMRGDGTIYDRQFDFILILDWADQAAAEKIASVKHGHPRGNFLYVSDVEYRMYPRDRRLQFFLTRRIHGDYDFGNPPTRKDILATAISYAIQIKDSLRPLLFDFIEERADMQQLLARAHVCLKRMDDCFLRVLCMYTTGKYPLHSSHLLECDDSDTTAGIIGVLNGWHSRSISPRGVCETLQTCDEVLNAFLRQVADRKI
ncbi:MAG: GTP cyclohydrolase II [Candidatus Peribacteraceae bacterium]|jgi:GTP cyclohydrolase II|nr:GTP cyclohydrolase II [Candidatus Peribacteraceae bacterium]